MAEKHSERAHARLSCSGSSRWMNCPGSVQLEEIFMEGKEDKSSVYAEEGTLAHEISEVLIASSLLPESAEAAEVANLEKKLKTLKKSPLYYDGMVDDCSPYVEYVLNRTYENRNADPGASTILEERFDLRDFIPEGFGSGDAVLYANSTVEIVDLKFGRGVQVDAEENSQLKLYGLGALRLFSLFAEITTVKMTIVQPRLNHISTYELSREALEAWGFNEVKPKAELALSENAPIYAGEHCLWCKAKPKCRALAEKQNDVAKHAFAEPGLLTDEEVLGLLPTAIMLRMWTESVEKHMYETALEGKKWPGHKLVEGKSSRKWKDEKEVKKALKNEGLKPSQYTETKLQGVTKVEKTLGKERFYGLHLTIKPPGKPALVPESDKRPELNADSAAAETFGTKE